MKILFLIALALPSLASAESFSLSLESRNFTCTEGGGGCVCRRKSEGSNYLAAYSGDIYLKGDWEANSFGLEYCRQWIKQSPACN